MSDPELSIVFGYRLAGGTDLVSLAGQLRELAEPIRRDLELTEIAHFAAQILDEADLNGTARPASAVFNAVDAQGQHVASVMAGEHNCPTVTMALAVTDDPDTGDLLALAYHDHEEYARALDGLGVLEYFPYWNEDATGRPRPLGITAADWSARGAVWERALRGTDPAQPSGMFRIELGSPLPGADTIIQSQEILEKIPDRAVRIEAAVKRLVREQEFTSPMEAFKFAQTLPAHAARIDSALKPITLEDLAGGIK